MYAAHAGPFWHGYYSQLATRRSVTPADIFTNHLARTKVNLQFTRALSLRAIADYNALMPTPSLIQAELSKRVTGDVLLTYLVNPFTAFYAGYTERYDNIDLDTSTPPRLRLIQSPVTRTSRQLLMN